MKRLRRLRCSFCGKDETEVLKLVAGPRVYICDVCVATASRMMNEPRDETPTPGVRPWAWRGLLRRAGRWLRGSGARRVGSSSAAG